MPSSKHVEIPTPQVQRPTPRTVATIAFAAVGLLAVYVGLTSQWRLLRPGSVGPIESVGPRHPELIWGYWEWERLTLAGVAACTALVGLKWRPASLVATGGGVLLLAEMLYAIYHNLTTPVGHRVAAVLTLPTGE